MIVYAVVFCTAVLVAQLAQSRNHADFPVTDVPRKTNLSVLVVFLILAGVSAARWRVGTDYWTYERLFDTYVAEFREGINFLEEPGIRFLAWLSNSFGYGSAGMFALAAFVTVGLTIRSIWRWSPAFGFSTAVYILAGAWHGSFNGVRQYLAAAILLSGHRYIIERRLIRWLLTVLVASLFHVTALIGVLMYFIPRKRLSTAAQFGLLLLAVMLLMGTAQFLDFAASSSQDPEIWSSDYVQRNVNPFRIAFQCLPLILYWILPVRKKISGSADWFYANMLLFIAGTAIAGAGSAYLTRFAIYPSLFLPIALAKITSLENEKEKTLIRTALLVVMGVFMYIEISGIENLSNFQWIFNKIRD